MDPLDIILPSLLYDNELMIPSLLDIVANIEKVETSMTYIFLSDPPPIMILPFGLNAMALILQPATDLYNRFKNLFNTLYLLFNE